MEAFLEEWFWWLLGLALAVAWAQWHLTPGQAAAPTQVAARVPPKPSTPFLDKDNYIGKHVMIAWECAQGWVGGCDVAVLQHLAGITDLSLLCRAASSVDAKAIQDRLMASLGPHGLRPHRVLCYGTSIGKQAVVRQMTPTLYIDSDVEVIKYLHKHIPYLVRVDKALTGREPFAENTNIVAASSVASYVRAVSTSSAF